MLFHTGIGMKYIMMSASSHKMLNQCWFNVGHRLRRQLNVKPTFDPTSRWSARHAPMVYKIMALLFLSYT